MNPELLSEWWKQAPATLAGIVSLIVSIVALCFSIKANRYIAKHQIYDKAIKFQDKVSDLDLKWESVRAQYYETFYNVSKNKNHQRCLVLSEQMDRIKYEILNVYELMLKMIFTANKKDQYFLLQIFLSEILLMLRDRNMLSLVLRVPLSSYPELLKLRVIGRVMSIHMCSFENASKAVSKKNRINT